MRFFDCVDSNIFDNYWYLDGLSEKFGYQRFKQLNIRGDMIEVTEAPSVVLTLYTIFISFIKFLTMWTVIVPAITMAGKTNFRLTHSFVLSEKPLELAERIRVGTYNVLFPQKMINGAPSKFGNNVGYNLDGKGVLLENSEMRTEIIAKNILRADLDVICLQEITDEMGQDLKEVLKDSYELKWVKHGIHDGVGILYKNNKFDLLNEQTSTIHVQMEDLLNPGSYQPSPPRTQLRLDLKDMNTDKIFRIVSCHMFDPNSLQNKEDQTKKVIEFAEETPGDYTLDRIVIAGDMSQDQFGDAQSPPQNVMPSEKLAPSFQPFIDGDYHVDGNLESTEYEKKLPGNGKINSRNRRPDWIWVEKMQANPSPHFRF